MIINKHKLLIQFIKLKLETLLNTKNVSINQRALIWFRRDINADVVSSETPP